MRLAPLEDLDATGAPGLIFDVDDTVTREGRLERVAFDAMWRLHDAGWILLAVTGRPLGWADVIARHWPVALAVGENGAGWSDPRGDIGYFADEPSRAAQRTRLDTLRAEIAREFPEVPLADDQRARRCDLAFDVGERVQLPRGRVDALVRRIERSGMRAVVSSVHCHAVPGAWNKAEGLARALEASGLPELDAGWVFVGDSGNDAAAFERIPRSVGVANVRAHLRRLPVAPAYVTKTDRGSGFAELAHHLLREER